MSTRYRRGSMILIGIGVLLLLVVGGMYGAVEKWPALGAQGADLLRSVFGDQAVAKLEMFVFQVRDVVQKWKYRSGMITPAAPWQVAVVPTLPTATLAPSLTVTPSKPKITATIILAPTKHPIQGATLPSAATGKPLTSTSPPTPTISLTPTFTLSPTPVVWQLTNIPPLGSMQGEGIWQSYIRDATGRVIAYRTFLQPDKERPFAVIAVVAFDLTHTRLHYILGYEEPFSPDGPKRTGAMPAADKVPGILLAAFNGGFKATHGQFGAMSGGVVALPPRDGVGTLAIYEDGQVKMGMWGSEITPTVTMAAWRQNGPLVIQDGQINPQIYNNSAKDWGYTIDDVSPTWRSGIGLNADGKTLFYFAGSSLSMASLANGMLDAGATEALQLDINNYWVHFVAVRVESGKLALDPLFPDTMNENIDRYLYPHGRDFFYVTARP